jgi:tricorn protease
VNYPLLDLGEFRIPQGVWFNAEGVSMENNGAEPDVRVDDTPEEWFNGRDSQLEKAIEIANSYKQ